jgi:threonine synthase
LVCRECGAQSLLGASYACLECFGPLEVGYTFPDEGIARRKIETGPNNMWRYAPLLPVPADITGFRSTEPGFTRLVDARNLADELGLRQLWVKDDSTNPTHSFKDRVVAVALSAARELGMQVLACPSTGNLANAVAAAAARAGIRSVVMIPSNLEQQKIVASAIYDTTLVAVEGSYDDVNRLASEIAGEQEGWAFVNVNVRPYYAEGSKTLGFEIAEQLGWRLPDQVVVPVASGAQLTKIDKGFRELVGLGLVEDKPYRIFGAQATGCSPVAQAYRAGHDVVAPVKPATIAKSLAIGNPADGPYALDAVRRTGGAIADVDDDTVIANIRRLARTEGIFGETAGGVTAGVAAKLITDGVLDPDAETVVINSGDGLKTLDAVADHVGPKITIPPNYDAFDAFWKDN